MFGSHPHEPRLSGCWQVIAFSTPPAKLEELRNLFIKMDVDDSGTISLKEFQEAMSLHPEVTRTLTLTLALTRRP